MPTLGSINLQTEVQPGKPRDPFLEQQMSKIEAAINAANAAIVALQLFVSGLAVASIDTAYTASVADCALFCDTTTAGFTVTLDNLVDGIPQGKMYAVRNQAGANNVTVVGNNESGGGTYAIATLTPGQGIITVHSSLYGHRVFGNS